MRLDPDKQWLLTPYKFFYAELEETVNDWHAEWREPVCLDKVSMGPPTDAPIDPVHKDDQ